MSLRDHSFSAADFPGAGSNRDAIDGFSAIATALDQGIDATGSNGTKIADAAAIGLGWLVLAAVIFYPATQLAAIGICLAFLCMRSFIRYIFGLAVSSPEWPPGLSRAPGQSFSAA